MLNSNLFWYLLHQISPNYLLRSIIIAKAHVSTFIARNVLCVSYNSCCNCFKETTQRLTMTNKST